MSFVIQESCHGFRLTELPSPFLSHRNDRKSLLSRASVFSLGARAYHKIHASAHFYFNQHLLAVTILLSCLLRAASPKACTQMHLFTLIDSVQYFVVLMVNRRVFFHPVEYGTPYLANSRPHS